MSELLTLLDLEVEARSERSLHDHPTSILKPSSCSYMAYTSNFPHIPVWRVQCKQVQTTEQLKFHYVLHMWEKSQKFQDVRHHRLGFEQHKRNGYNLKVFSFQMHKIFLSWHLLLEFSRNSASLETQGNNGNNFWKAQVNSWNKYMKYQC